MPTADVVLGPYIVRRGAPAHVCEGVENTGCVLEFVTAEPHTVEIYHCWLHAFQKHDFSSYFIREIALPFGIQCFNFQVKDYPGGPYITLSAFLAELYELRDGVRRVQHVLVDLAESLEIRDGRVTRSFPPLRSDLDTKGYQIANVLPYGRRILVDFTWEATARDSSKRLVFAAGGADFRPKPDKSLGVGKWSPPRQHFVEKLLFEELSRLTNGQPIDALSTESRAMLIDEFEWTPLALMSAKQAREARIQFIRQNSTMARDLNELAQALKAAKLYSEETSTSQIRKFLPSLLKAARFQQ